MRRLKLLKLDSVHPPAYLHEKQAAEKEAIGSMDYAAYYRWVMGLRNNTSDSFTHYMNEAGWEAREFITTDEVMLQKLEDSGQIRKSGVEGEVSFYLRHLGNERLRDIVRGRLFHGYRQHRKYWRVAEYIRTFRPDVLFVREPCHLDGRFLDQFRERCLIVSMIACQTNHAWNWEAHRSNLIFTFTEEYRRFFEVQGIASEVISLGFDDRVAAELADLPKIHDCTFVGYLGVPAQSRKTELLAHVAERASFKWWGVKGEELERYPSLLKTWQGGASGLDMLKIYRQSKIVLNDYPDFMQGHGNNMRNLEVFTAGSMLLTRVAANLAELERAGALATFDTAQTCLTQIGKYLRADDEREAIARQGRKIARDRFHYRDIVRRMMDTIADADAKRRPHLHSWA